MSTRINLNGINELDLTLPGTTTATVSNGVVSVSNTGGGGVLPSGPANEVIATPNGSSGISSLRSLVPADLPIATTSALGVVKPDGSTITISSGVISATGGGSGYSLGGSLNSSNVTLLAGAGAGATLTQITGLDGTHFITIVTGTSPTASQPIWSVTFTTPRGHVVCPVITLIGAGSVGNPYSSIGQMVWPTPSSGTGAGYTVSSSTTALSGGISYTWAVSCP